MLQLVIGRKNAGKTVRIYERIKAAYLSLVRLGEGGGKA